MKHVTRPCLNVGPPERYLLWGTGRLPRRVQVRPGALYAVALQRLAPEFDPLASHHWVAELRAPRDRVMAVWRHCRGCLGLHRLVDPPGV